MLLICISRLGESVIKALVRMKCPYPLQTFQIKGLDYINIFPVVQWLIKKVRLSFENEIANLNFRLWKLELKLEICLERFPSPSSKKASLSQRIPQLK